MSPAPRSQFEAARNEWLVPLVERVGALEREVGRIGDIAAAAAPLWQERARTLEGEQPEALMLRLQRRLRRRFRRVVEG